MENAAYRDEEEVKAIVEKFERCDFKLEELTHACHLTVAAWYLAQFPADEALLQMRAGLRRFIEHHGKQGYHETVTRFWMELIGSFLSSMPAAATTTQRVNTVLERYRSKDILYEHYTRECVMSDAARAAWVEPDLKAISDAAYSHVR